MDAHQKAIPMFASVVTFLELQAAVAYRIPYPVVFYGLNPWHTCPGSGHGTSILSGLIFSSFLAMHPTSVFARLTFILPALTDPEVDVP